MASPGPQIISAGARVAVRGTLFRAVAADHQDAALAGSVRPGRYSRGDQPTLYLSASRAGATAAVAAHPFPRNERVVLAFDVAADAIVDLRDPLVLAEVRRAAGDPFAPWQPFVARGEPAPSWLARDWIERGGALGLIDPSRRMPGLWHLVLFGWNAPGLPSVR